MEYSEKRIKKLLFVLKSYYEDKPPTPRYGSWFDTSIPDIIKLTGYPVRFIQALMKYNIDNYEEWGSDEYEPVIPQEKNFYVEVEWSGREYVTVTYDHKIEAYDEDEVSDMISNCNPCYDEGRETYRNYIDSDGDWSIQSIDELIESKIHKIKNKIVLKENSKKEEKLLKFIDLYMNNLIEDCKWYQQKDEDYFWLINPKRKEWIAEYRSKTNTVFIFDNILKELNSFTGSDDLEIKKQLDKWFDKYLGLYERVNVVPYFGEQKSTIDIILQDGIYWDKMNKKK